MAKEPEPRASLAYDAAQPDEMVAFVKRAWTELRTLRRVRVWQDRFRVYDINGDCLEVTGIGYPTEGITRLLDAVYAAYSPDVIHDPIAGDFKEFLTGKRYPWAQDRVM